MHVYIHVHVIALVMQMVSTLSSTTAYHDLIIIKPGYELLLKCFCIVL